MENKFYELEIRVGGKTGTYFAVGPTLEHAMAETKSLILEITGLYPIILGSEESPKSNHAG